MQSTIDAPGLTPLVSASQIAHRVEEMARDIVADFDTHLAVLVLLKNGFIFAADLVRALGRVGAQLTIDFVTPDGTAPGLGDLAGRSVLVIDAILDTGRTVQQAMDLARQAGAAEIRLAVLLDRPSRQSPAPAANYTGFILPDRYVVGYGVDRDELFRERPDVAAFD